MAIEDIEDIEATVVIEAMMDIKVSRGFQAETVKMAVQAQKDAQVKKEIRDLLVQLDQGGIKAKMASLVQRVTMVKMEKMVNMVSAALRAKMVTMACFIH